MNSVMQLNDAADASAPVFAFTGQGSQYPGMTARLYLEHRNYRRHLEQAAEALLPYTGTSVVDLIVNSDERIHQTGFTQPSLFAVEYALAATFAEAGVRPSAVIGHSIGEFAAAVTAGALPLEDAAILIAARGMYMQYLPAGGGMLAVGAAEEDVDDLLETEPEVTISAYNAPTAITLSGEVRALERVGEALAGRGVKSMALRVSHAFHSPLMEPMLDKYAMVAERVPARAPAIPFYSTVYGRPLNEGEQLDAAYWRQHIVAPVRFAPAAVRLLADLQPRTVVEIGPKPVLTNLLRRIAGVAAPRLLAACRDDQTGPRDLDELVERLRETTESSRLPARS